MKGIVPNLAVRITENLSSGGLFLERRAFSRGFRENSMGI
jgi:hypothetical protein